MSSTSPKAPLFVLAVRIGTTWRAVGMFDSVEGAQQTRARMKAASPKSEYKIEKIADLEGSPAHD